jgi:D-sedoheptulose 7-phosphate isomerase
MNPFDELIDVLQRSRELELEREVEAAGAVLADCLRAGGKVLTCGNGGSAADALHLAQELVGKYQVERRALPAICLSADPTALTCIGNDFGFEQIFARQVAALAQSSDVLVAITTSGNSANVLAAITAAKTARARTILLSGRDGGRARGQCDSELIVPSASTARVQEVHTLIIHTWLERIDRQFGTQ